jgi:hypothetical protein
MTRSYYEHVERKARPEAATWDVVIFEDPDAADLIEVVEHEVPPPELLPLMAREMTQHERIVTGCTRSNAERKQLDALCRALSGSTRE